MTTPDVAPGLGQIVADIDGRIAHLEPLAAELEQLRAMRNTLQPSANGNGHAIDVQVLDEPPAPPALEEAAAAEPPADPIPSGKDDTGRSRSRPRRPRPAAASSNAGGTIRARVLAYVEQQDGDVKVAQVAQAIGVTPAAARQHLKRLVNAGLIDAQGATASRVYRSKRSADQAAAARPQAKKTGVNGSLPNLKALVLNAIARDPGELHEEGLAFALDVDREDVAVACGELLDHGDVVLHADGCYSVNLQGGGC